MNEYTVDAQEEGKEGQGYCRSERIYCGCSEGREGGMRMVQE